MKMKDLLDKKGYNTFTVKQDEFVSNVVQILAEHNIGDVLVLNDSGKLVGIVSERDIIRKCLFLKQRVAETKVSSIMTSDLIVALLSDEVEDVMTVMTKNKIRHMPVIHDESKELAGLISIGDLVKAIVESKEVENRYLRDYISNNSC